MPVESIRIPLGTRIPWFDLEDLGGQRFTTADCPTGRPVLIAFLCNHSPYVVQIEQSLAQLADDLARQDVFVLAIASNDARAYPADDLEHLVAQVKRSGWPFPYCLDPDQRAAKAFRAACTPEFFLYDEDARLAYHGQFDGSRPGASAEGPAGADLIAAVNAVLESKPVARTQHAAFGCSIKWSAGNEPSYVFTS